MFKLCTLPRKTAQSKFSVFSLNPNDKTKITNATWLPVLHEVKEVIHEK